MCFWIGVGVRYRMRSAPSRLSAAHAGMELRSSSKLCIEGTAASLSPAPRRFTGMASYVWKSMAVASLPRVASPSRRAGGRWVGRQASR